GGAARGSRKDPPNGRRTRTDAGYGRQWLADCGSCAGGKRNEAFADVCSGWLYGGENGCGGRCDVERSVHPAEGFRRNRKAEVALRAVAKSTGVRQGRSGAGC